MVKSYTPDNGDDSYSNKAGFCAIVFRHCYWADDGDFVYCHAKRTWNRLGHEQLILWVVPYN